MTTSDDASRTLPVGAALDEEVQRRVLGQCVHELYEHPDDRAEFTRRWNAHEDCHRWYRCRHCADRRQVVQGSRPGVVPVPGYSSGIAAAWVIVEHLRARGWTVTLTAEPPGHPDVGWCCRFERFERDPEQPSTEHLVASAWQEAPTPAAAISRAALAASRPALTPDRHKEEYTRP